MAKSTIPVAPEAPAEDRQGVAVSAGGAANQHLWRNIGLIIGREYTNRIRQRSFKISTIILLILIAIAACLPTFIQFLSAKSNSTAYIAVVNNAGSIANLSSDQLTHYINTNLNGSQTQSGGSSQTAPFTLQMGTDSASLLQSVKSGKLDILLVIDRGSDQSLQFTYYARVSAISDGNLPQIQALAGQLNVLDKSARFGLTPQQTSSLFTPPAFQTVNTQPGARSVSDQLTGYFISYAGEILIFMTIFMYGVGVAQGVAEEKGSRIMEILVNAATPIQLMVGKIIGLGAAGLTQMLCLVVVGISALLLQNPLQTALLGTSSNPGLAIITHVSINLLLLVLLYFVLGFLLYSTLFAALGALVRRQEEAQNAIQPLTWLFMVGYLSSILGGVTSANALWMKVLSYVPFWTPTVMLMRIGAGSASGWEIAVSIVVMLVAILLCALLTARVYRVAVLMYGQKPGLGQLIRIARMK